MSIPIFINVRNRLTTTQKLVEQCALLPNAVPILVDNDSSWPPLLEWYKTCPFEVYYLRNNVGHHAPWTHVISQTHNFISKWGEFYVVTDCDLDIGRCPIDLLEVLRAPFELPATRVTKVGTGLQIDDLPPWQSNVVNWESQWWKKPAKGIGNYYWAAIDTTFAMYRSRTPISTATKVVGVKSLRTGFPYVARHTPWYLDGDNLDPENKHYFLTSSASNSWKPDGKGLTIHSSYVTPSNSLHQLYESAKGIPSDINEHLPYLYSLARECAHITELGTRYGVSTTAFLYAQPGELISIDIQAQPGHTEKLIGVTGSTTLKFVVADTLFTEIGETDLLFIDTWHTRSQAYTELCKHGNKARKYIVLHDIETFGIRGEDGGQGLWPAVYQWLSENLSWEILDIRKNNNGLLTLRRR